MSTYIAVDGGNSKTDLVIGATDGTVLASVRGDGTCHQNIGMDETQRRLADLGAQALAAAGLSTVDHVAAYLAGADLPSEVEELSGLVAGLGWAPEVTVDNDTFALLRAGTDAPDAIAVVCGAGINCVGRSAAGRTARFPSLGQLSGDWGGGDHLGSAALWHAVRDEDGRGPATALTRAVADHFGLPTVEAVSAAMHLGGLDPLRQRELAPILFSAADSGDPVARRVVARQATEIVALATVAAARLDLRDMPHAVVLGGGVLRPRHPLLHDAVVAGILAESPKATVTVVEAPPVVGAALHALDSLGAPSSSHHLLRSSL